MYSRRTLALLICGLSLVASAQETALQPAVDNVKNNVKNTADRVDERPAKSTADPKNDAGKYATNHSFPKTAFDYAKMVEPDLGVPPRVDLGTSVEIPLYVDGVQTYGNLGRDCDNPSFLGKATVSGSILQRYEGRSADGKVLPDVVWVSFGRNSSSSHDKVIGSVQMIGYNRKSGATAFFESSDRIGAWVRLEKGTLRMQGTMPWIDDPQEFNKAFVPPGNVQCVECHQNDPFITNSFINAAKLPGTDVNVVPILDKDSPYYVIGGDNWDMRTIHIEGNACFDCHRVGMSTMTMFMRNGWKPNEHMPPHDPGSLAKELDELLAAWEQGPEQTANAEWIIPPSQGKPRRVVDSDYPYQSHFNRPAKAKRELPKGRKHKKTETQEPNATNPEASVEAERLLKELRDADTREAFEAWFKDHGVSQEALEKLRSMVNDGKS